MGAESARIGRRIAGKYVLARRLASGGMGDVWLARNEATQALVALKMLRAPKAEGEATSAEARFRQEARVSARLTHPNIVRVFDLVEEPGGDLVLVMELLRGESLRGWLARVGPRSTREAVAVLVPVLAGLEHAHRAGIVHRDVTPANVILALEGGAVVPKIVDFGIAKAAGATRTQTLDGTVLGTPRYMAPEQIRGNPLDGRADVFSVAAILYEAVTGVAPFAGSTPSAELAAVLEGAVDPEPSLEPRTWLEIERALSKRPYERHASAEDFARALEASVGETRASLATCLASAPPPLAAEVDAGADGGARTMGGQSLGAMARALGAPRWWMGAALALGSAVMTASLVTGLRPRRAEATLAPAPAAIASSDAPSLPPTPPSATADVGPTPPPAAESVVAPPPKPQRRPPARPSPRPVATTPGF